MVQSRASFSKALLELQNMEVMDLSQWAKVQCLIEANEILDIFMVWLIKRDVKERLDVCSLMVPGLKTLDQKRFFSFLW